MCKTDAKQYRNTVASPQFAPKWIMCAREENQACWCIDAYWSQSGMPAVREVVRMGCFHAHRTHYGPRSQVLFRAWTALGLRYAAGMYLHGWEHWESDVSLCQWWRQHRGLKQDVENAWQVLTVRDSLHYSILAVSEQKISSECSVTWKKGNVTSLCVFRVSPQFELISGALVIDFVCHVI